MRDGAIERLLECDPVAARSLVPLLLRKLKGPEFFDAVSAMWALAKLRHRDAIEEIREAGRAGRREGKTFQGITADVINDLLEGRDTELVAALERHDHDRMSALAKAASLIGSPEALAALRRCVESAPDDDCRLACAAALRRGVEHAWPKGAGPTQEIRRLTAGLRKPQGASRQSLEKAGKALGIAFPDDYVEFMLESDGAEGPIGKSSYLALYPVGALVDNQRNYAVDELAPGLVLFGSDGGGTAYAFDKRSSAVEIVEVPFIPLSLEEARPVGRSFESFLAFLAAR